MRNKCECKGKNANGGKSQPKLFSIHFYDDGKNGGDSDVTYDSEGKADLSKWDESTRPPKGKEVLFNFDYGWVEDSGAITHANHLHDPNGKWGPMIIFQSQPLDWANRPQDFNDEVWCVACDDVKKGNVVK